ncbi:MAG: hypothetical protein A3F91_13255 [Flavobacteria bacterium RIFCSPLOWO2_12_FULL_35_11]|nr:MAG: hypothetical protein A3F91_13255 [Flavobacteria bacterium RIFCSPLOWO2_12_FULL_35_11]
MNEKMNILYQKWANLKPLNFIFITTILMILLTVPISIIIESLGISYNEYGGFDSEKYNIVGLIFIALIFAPMLETLIAQQIPILLTQNFIKYNPNMIGILLSTLIFSILHFSYSIWYAIAVLPAGFLLANTFVLFQKREESGFWMTSFVHSFRNLIPLIIFISDKYIT